jgi:hypothetical protein
MASSWDDLATKIMIIIHQRFAKSAKASITITNNNGKSRNSPEANE